MRKVNLSFGNGLVNKSAGLILPSIWSNTKTPELKSLRNELKQFVNTLSLFLELLFGCVVVVTTD